MENKISEGQVRYALATLLESFDTACRFRDVMLGTLDSDLTHSYLVKPVAESKTDFIVSLCGVNILASYDTAGIDTKVTPFPIGRYSFRVINQFVEFPQPFLTWNFNPRGETTDRVATRMVGDGDWARRVQRAHLSSLLTAYLNSLPEVDS